MRSRHHLVRLLSHVDLRIAGDPYVLDYSGMTDVNPLEMAGFRAQLRKKADTHRFGRAQRSEGGHDLRESHTGTPHARLLKPVISP